MFFRFEDLDGFQKLLIHQFEYNKTLILSIMSRYLVVVLSF